MLRSAGLLGGEPDSGRGMVAGAVVTGLLDAVGVMSAAFDDLVVGAFAALVQIVAAFIGAALARMTLADISGSSTAASQACPGTLRTVSLFRSSSSQPKE